MKGHIRKSMSELKVSGRGVSENDFEVVLDRR
jgi:hypothetical protein